MYVANKDSATEVISLTAILYPISLFIMCIFYDCFDYVISNIYNTIRWMS